MPETLSPPQPLIQVDFIQPTYYYKRSQGCENVLDMDELLTVGNETSIDAGGAGPCLIAYIKGDVATLITHLSLATPADITDYLLRFQEPPTKGKLMMADMQGWMEEERAFMEFYYKAQELIASTQHPQACLFGQNYCAAEIKSASLDSPDDFMRWAAEFMLSINPELPKEFLDNVLTQWHVTKLLVELGIPLGRIQDFRLRSLEMPTTHTLFLPRENQILWTLTA